MGTQNKEKPTASEIYLKGQENLKKIGVDQPLILGNYASATAMATRQYLDSLFFIPSFIDIPEADTGVNLFGKQLKTPAFCSAISRNPYIPSYIPKSCVTDVGNVMARMGALMMIGIGGSDELQKTVDTGASVVKIIKPYHDIDLIYNKARDAVSRGCIAIGMDTDFSLGRLHGDRVTLTETFRQHSSGELKQLIAEVKIPFIIKGVLSISDARKAVSLGASAIVVSNHSVHSFAFGIPAPIVLPEIVDSVGKRITVLVDSGFKTGNDVLKGLALGAKAIGFGYPLVYALMADGADGVENLMENINAELNRSMRAVGCATVADVSRSVLVEIP